MRWLFLGVGVVLVVLALARARGRWALVLFASVFFLVGMFFMGYGLETFWLSMSARSWPTVEGTVVSSWVQEEKDSDGDITYRPVVEYRYTYRGKTYTSRRLWAGGGLSGSQYWAEKVVSRYPPGKTVRVYVRPGHPDYAVLETGATPTGGFLILFGLVFALVGGGMLAFFTLSDRVRIAPQDMPSLFLTGFGFLWLLMTLPLALETVSKIRDGRVDLLVFVGIGVVLIGIGFLGVGGTMLVRRLRGRSIEIQVPEPVHPGDEVCARIVLPPGRFKRVRVRLSCLSRIVRKTSDGYTAETLTLWSQENIVHPHQAIRGVGGSHVEVCFRLPSDLPPSGEQPLSEATRSMLLENIRKTMEKVPGALRNLVPDPESLLPEKETILWTLEVRVEQEGPDAVKTQILTVVS